MANLRYGMPMSFFIFSIASFNETFCLRVMKRPAPSNGLSDFSKIGFVVSTANALANQSLTPPLAESQLVCGENTAILFLIHSTTILSFHVLE